MKIPNRLSNVYQIQFIKPDGSPLEGEPSDSLIHAFREQALDQAADRKRIHNTLAWKGRAYNKDGDYIEISKQEQQKKAYAGHPKAYPATWVQQWSPSSIYGDNPDSRRYREHLNYEAERYGRTMIYNPDNMKEIFILQGKRARQYHRLEQILDKFVKNHGTPYDSPEGTFKQKLISQEKAEQLENNLKQVGANSKLAKTLSELVTIQPPNSFRYAMELKEGFIRALLSQPEFRSRIPRLKVAPDNLEKPKRFKVIGRLNTPD